MKSDLSSIAPKRERHGRLDRFSTSGFDGDISLYDAMPLRQAVDSVSIRVEIQGLQGKLSVNSYPRLIFHDSIDADKWPQV